MDGTRGASPPDRDDDLVTAARDVLAADGTAYTLQPWQVAYLLELREGRPGRVPPGCGSGRGWLQARLDETIAARRARDIPG